MSNFAHAISYLLLNTQELPVGKIYKQIVSVDCGSPHRGRFEAKLDLCGNGVDNHILLITLRLNLKQVTSIDNWTFIPNGFNAEPFKWSVSEWSEFQRKLRNCGAFWHRRFCLVPPDDSADVFKYKGGWLQQGYMPNIECHFQLEFTGPNDRHWEVKVLKAAQGIAESANTGIGTVEIDSTDADPASRTYRDGVSELQIAAAHEIGHMLGQPHAGALLKTNDCLRAIALAMKETPPDPQVPNYLLNSHNASACYGLIDGKLVAGVAENVMGLGMAITEVNAISWEKALAQLVWGKESLPNGWKSVMRSYSGPRAIV